MKLNENELRKQKRALQHSIREERVALREESMRVKREAKAAKLASAKAMRVSSLRDQLNELNHTAATLGLKQTPEDK